MGLKGLLGLRGLILVLVVLTMMLMEILVSLLTAGWSPHPQIRHVTPHTLPSHTTLPHTQTHNNSTDWTKKLNTDNFTIHTQLVD